MNELYHYEVKIYSNPDDFLRKNKFVNEVVRIAAENEKFIIVNDWYFTKICKDDNYSDYQLNKKKIYWRTNNHILDDGLFYYLYSEKKKTPAAIKKELQNFIDKQIGYLGSIDLSIIK